MEGDFSQINGYWSGVLATEHRELRLVGFVSDVGRMVIYSIDQGNVPFISARSSFADGHFYFSFPPIEGVYEGRLEGRELHGNLVQSQDRRRQLKMEYSREMPELLRGAIDETMTGDLQSLQGYWWGYLGGNKGLFLYLQITTVGVLSIAQLYTPDQHHRAIMVSSTSLDGQAFKFFSKQVKGSYSGKLARDRNSIKGFWKQGLLPTPLTLYFSEEKPERE